MLEPHLKHNLHMVDPSSQQAVQMGCVASLTDSKSYKISAELTITKIISKHEVDLAQLPSVLFSVSKEKYDPKGKIKDFINYLKEKQNKVGVILLDSHGTIGYLTHSLPPDELLMNKTIGFRCFIKTVPSDDTVVVKDSKKRGFEQIQAADHYNSNLKRVKKDRHLSMIYHLRELNNWVKSTIINIACRHYSTTCPSVLDFGCGMGGDINKWLKGHIGVSNYVGVDIALNSLKHFVNERLSAYTKEKYKFTKLICADIGTESLTSSTLHMHTWDSSGNSKWYDGIPLTINDKFDLVSCQFAVHYMFQSRQKAKHFLQEVSRHLKPGGLFIVTTIDSRVVTDMILERYTSGVKRSKLSDNSDRSDQDSSMDQQRLVISDEFENKLLTITFKDDSWHHLVEIGAKHSMDNNEVPFGIQYDFNLHDSDDMSAVNAPEWLVPSGSPLQDLVEECGLTVQSNQNFHQFVESNIANSSYREHMENRGVFNYKGTMSSAEWNIARLYTVIVFERKFENSSQKLNALDSNASATMSNPVPPTKVAVLEPHSPPVSPPPSPPEVFEPRSPSSPPPSPPKVLEPRSPSSPPPSPPKVLEPRSPSSPPPSPSMSTGLRSPINSPPPSPRTPPTAPPPHLKKQKDVVAVDDDDGPVYTFDD